MYKGAEFGSQRGRTVAARAVRVHFRRNHVQLAPTQNLDVANRLETNRIGDLMCQPFCCFEHIQNAANFAGIVLDADEKGSAHRASKRPRWFKNGP